ncbi:hypothetical protein BJF90_12110 [Pseudonocardia sp. CNS-004]|nr:hypothetical protein BJF90_12110 [Pseudonocardia sp. CNS-004]
MATTTHSTVIAALRAVGVAEDAYGPTLNTARSPRDVDVLGARLAEEIRAVAAPTALVVWDTSDEAVLAHVVARSLDVGVLRAFEVEGILGLDPDIADGTPVALLATQWGERRLATLRTLVENRGGRTVAVAAALGSPALSAVPDVPAVSLAGADEATDVPS